VQAVSTVSSTIVAIGQGLVEVIVITLSIFPSLLG
jgi:hypothetical protein